MNADLTEFQQRATAIAVVKMLSGKHFSICDLDAIAKTMGREQSLAGKDYSALRGIHCMDWIDMGPDLARMTREKCLELLGLPPETLEMAQEVATEPTHKPAHRLRLAFWKSA